jgi:hypothetical protein
MMAADVLAATRLLKAAAAPRSAATAVPTALGDAVAARFAATAVLTRPRKIESSRGRDACSQGCRSRTSTRCDIVELTVRQLYGTFSIRYADGCQKRRGGHQTKNVTTHSTAFHNQALKIALDTIEVGSHFSWYNYVRGRNYNGCLREVTDFITIFNFGSLTPRGRMLFVTRRAG